MFAPIRSATNMKWISKFSKIHSEHSEELCDNHCNVEAKDSGYQYKHKNHAQKWARHSVLVRTTKGGNTVYGTDRLDGTYNEPNNFGRIEGQSGGGGMRLKNNF
jgi:hypothetical protein